MLSKRLEGAHAINQKREPIFKPHCGDRVEPGAVSAPGQDPNKREKPHSGRARTVYSTDRDSIHLMAKGSDPGWNATSDSVRR